MHTSSFMHDMHDYLSQSDRVFLSCLLINSKKAKRIKQSILGGSTVCRESAVGEGALKANLNCIERDSITVPYLS